MNQPDKKLRVLVVDDSALYRKIVKDVLNSIPEVEVIGTASNGVIALERIEELQPDFITLDLEMPELDGLGVLDGINKLRNGVNAVMVSAFTAGGAKATTAALQRGAFDFVLKPNTGSPLESQAEFRKNLKPIVQAIASSRGLTTIAQCIRDGIPRPKKSTPPSTALSRVAGRAVPKKAASATDSSPTTFGGGVKHGSADLVCIGVSTGGPRALSDLLPMLPEDFPVPVLVVQHMPPMFTKSLAEDLNRRCKLSVFEAVDGQEVLPGQILIAPGGKQMKIRRIEGVLRAHVTDDPPVNNCKPAVDYLFKSVAEHLGSRSLGVILTGMGNDGTAGAKLLKEKNSSIFVQDKESCVVYGMPRSVVEAGLADLSLPIKELSAEICKTVRKGVTV